MKDKNMWKVFYLEKNGEILELTKKLMYLGAILREIYIKSEDEEIKKKIENILSENIM